MSNISMSKEDGHLPFLTKIKGTPDIKKDSIGSSVF